MTPRAGFRNLPLFWKLLLPFLTLMVVVGAFGVFVMVRDLASRADVTLEQDLARRSLDVHSSLRSRELFLLESANLAANLEGMARAVEGGNATLAGRLLQSVMALKPDLDMASVTDRSGVGLVEFTRPAAAGDVSFGRGTNWSSNPLIRDVLSAPDGRKASGWMDHGGRRFLVLVAPICSSTEACAPVGAAIAGVTAESLARVAEPEGPAGSATGVALFDEKRRVMASEGVVVSTVPSGERRDVRRVGSVEVTTLYSPYEVQGQRIGTLAVSVPTAPALATVRGAALRLSLIVFLAMVGVVVVGAMLARGILRQVAALLDTNRSIGRGDLAARAPVESTDELGQLAAGVNQMAEALQASYETLELRVAERTEEVQRLLKERTEFFASLSHELRTPLAVILGEVKLMEGRVGGGPRWVGETARRLGLSAEQLLSLVNEVLDLARTETGRLEIRPAPVDLQRVIEDLRPTIEGLARKGGLDVEVSVARRLPAVLADRARLRDVVVNLVDNAVKYTPEGGRVELSARARNGVVRVSVSDTGVGIPADAVPLLFEPFYRVPGITPQRGQASSGLGLALAKRVVEAQGGELIVDSTPGRGSTFTFTLPRASKEKEPT